MTTTPNEPVGDDDLETVSGSDSSPMVSPGADADGTDGDSTDGTDADGTDGDGTDADGDATDGTDADGTDADGTDGTDGTDASTGPPSEPGPAGPADRRCPGVPGQGLGAHAHVHHTDPERLVGLLSLDDVDHLLTGAALRTPALRVARDGTVLPGSAYTRSAPLAGQPMTGLVDGRKAIALFEDGASLVLQGLQRYWPPLTDLVAALERALGHPCQANAYLTPPRLAGVRQAQRQP